MATPLKPQHLRAIMPNIPQQDEVTEFSACCSVMRRFEINTKKRAAAWLGNVAKESGELYYTEEIASGAAYEGREDLGNTVPATACASRDAATSRSRADTTTPA